MSTDHQVHPALLWRLLFYCSLLSSCVHCTVPKSDQTSVAYFNQTILIHRNHSAIVGEFESPKKSFKSSLQFDGIVDGPSIELANLSFSSKLIDVSDSPLVAKPFLVKPKSTSLIESSTSLSVVLHDDGSLSPARRPVDEPVQRPVEDAVQQTANDPVQKSADDPVQRSADDAVQRPSDDAVQRPSDDLVQQANDAAQRSAFHVDDVEIETLPKPEARVQQPQHTRSRTGSTTIDLSENKFGKPSIQYLNQSRPASTATYITKNNEVLTVSRAAVSKQTNKVTDLHIGALFPMTSSHSSGWLGGQGCKPAIGMALKDVNNSPNLLPGYHLVLHHNDSKCDPGLGTTVLYDLIYEPPIKLLILGGCSIVCSTIAETAKMYNLVVVGYGSSSPALSNRERFPTFFRTHPSATIHNPTRIKLFNKFGWKKIAVILEAEEVFISTGKDLEVQCKNAGIEIITRVSFLTDPQDAVKSLARQDARIIIGMFYGGAARKVMCEAYKQGLYGKQYVWFLIGWYEDDWYRQGSSEINCTIDEMSKAVEGHLTTEALILNRDGRNTIAGLTAEKWQRKYEQVLKQSIGDYDKNRRPEGYLEAPLAYDAIWAIALALNRTLPKLEEKGILIESFDYQNGTVIKDEIISSLKQIQFLGVSGEVAFSERGDRIALTQIEQMIEGKYNLLGYYDTQTDNLTWFNNERWVGDRPPPDHTQIVEKLIIVSTSFFVTANVLSVVGIVWAIGLLCFNYKFRNFRYIQASLPVTNNIMLFGFIISLSSIMLFGLDSQKVDESYFPMICHGRALFLSIGFSLSYGAMFVKIWLSYRLSTHMEHSIKKKDFEIYLTILAFCVIDLCILITWYLHSPMERKVEKFDLIDPEGTDEDIKIEPQLEICDANIIWYSLLFGFKGLLLIFGLFLAYETRSVKLKQINDSKLINMSIYNVVVLCMITGPVSLVITNQVNGHFAFITFTIICCCFLTMILVFVPKIVELVRRRGAQMAFGSNTNGTFHDNLSVQEQQEKFQKLTQENDELMTKISEKDSQIEEIRKQIEEITKIRRNASQKTNKKAVRIREPDEEEFEELNPETAENEEELEEANVETSANETTAVLESSTTSTTNPPVTSPNKKDVELYESYL